MSEKHEHDRLTDDGNPHPPMSTPEALAEYDAETVKLIVDAEKVANAAEAEWEDLKASASDAKKRAEAETSRLRALIRDRETQRGKRPEPTLLDLIPTAPKWRDVRIDSLPIADGIKAVLSFEPIKTAGELFDVITSFNPSDGTPFGLSISDVADVRAKLADMADHEAMLTDPKAAVSENLWREFPISGWSRFGLTEKDIERLEAGEVKKESKRFPILTVGDLSSYSEPAASGWCRKLTDIKGIGTPGADRIATAEIEFWAWWGEGGDTEFARDRGVLNGNATLSGTGSGTDEAATGPADPEDVDTDPDATPLFDRPGSDFAPEVGEVPQPAM